MGHPSTVVGRNLANHLGCIKLFSIFEFVLFGGFPANWVCHGIHHHEITTIWEKMFGTWSRHGTVANPSWGGSEMSDSFRCCKPNMFLTRQLLTVGKETGTQTEYNLMSIYFQCMLQVKMTTTAYMTHSPLKHVARSSRESHSFQVFPGW